MKTEKEIKELLEKRIMQKEGKLHMGSVVNHSTIDAIIRTLKWVIED